MRSTHKLKTEGLQVGVNGLAWQSFHSLPTGEQPRGMGARLFLGLSVSLTKKKAQET